MLRYQLMARKWLAFDWIERELDRIKIQEPHKLA